MPNVIEHTAFDIIGRFDATAAAASTCGHREQRLREGARSAGD
jgi:hypothetical protein